MTRERTVFKRGDIVKVKSQTFGSSGSIGEKFEIVSTGNPSPNPPANWNYTGRSLEKGDTLNIRQGDLMLAPKTKEEQLKQAKKDLKDAEKKVSAIKDEMEYLSNYKDKEDYLAHKIDSILKSGGGREEVRAFLKEKNPLLDI